MTRNKQFKVFFKDTDNKIIDLNYFLHDSIVAEKWFKKVRVFETLKPEFKYSYSKNQIRKFSKKKNFRLIGMGGSALGAKAIYHFLNHKISLKRKF